MQKFATMFILAMTLGLAAQTQAEPSTDVHIDELRRGRPVIGTDDQVLNVLCEHKASLKAAKLNEEFQATWVDMYFTPEHFPAPADCGINAKKERRVFMTTELLTALGITDRTWIRSGEAYWAMHKLGYLPDGWAGLLALAAAQPDLQRESPIVAFGYRWRVPNAASYCAPIVYESDGERYLYLFWDAPVDEWSSGYRFLAVRK